MSTSLPRASPSETPLACGGADGSPKTGPRTPGEGAPPGLRLGCPQPALCQDPLPGGHSLLTLLKVALRSWRFPARPWARVPPGKAVRGGEKSGPSTGCREESPTLGSLSGLLNPAQPPSTAGRASQGGGVGPGGHTQVPLGVGVQVRVQGPTLRDAASHDQHGVLIILQPGLGISLRRSVLHLSWQRQLQLFPKVGGRRLGARVGRLACEHIEGCERWKPPASSPKGHTMHRAHRLQDLEEAPPGAPGTEPPPTGSHAQSPPHQLPLGGPPQARPRTTEPGLQSSRVTRWRCWRSRRSAGCAGSRRGPSNVMKMGRRVSSSSRHRPSLRGGTVRPGAAGTHPRPARNPPEAVAAPGAAQEGVRQHYDQAAAAAQVHQQVGRRLCGDRASAGLGRELGPKGRGPGPEWGGAPRRSRAGPGRGAWGAGRGQGRGGARTGRGGAPRYRRAAGGRGRPGRACNPGAAPAAASG